MFDIGFSELLLIAVVALVVIGPERLPGVARNAGRFAGRLQRYVSDIKRDFNREIEFEEIRRLQQEMETTVQSMQASMRAVESTLQQEVAKQQVSLTNTSHAPDAPAVQPDVSARLQPGSTAAAPSASKSADAVANVVADAVTSADTASAEDHQYRLF